MSKNYFAKWYAKPENKASLSAKRKARYSSDPAYKQKVLKATESYRAGLRTRDRPPEGYVLNLKQVCIEVGISHQTFRSWRAKHYFPEPKYFKSRLIFTQNQVELLQDLQKSIASGDPDKVEDTVNLVYANWS